MYSSVQQYVWTCAAVCIRSQCLAMSVFGSVNGIVRQCATMHVDVCDNVRQRAIVCDNESNSVQHQCARYVAQSLLLISRYILVEIWI